MTPILAVIGVVLVIAAIPLGLMLAPLVIGAILLGFAMRRADRALNEPFRGAAA
jgi:predicted membrane protein